MKRPLLWTLVVLNIALVISLAMRFTRDNSALAQVRGRPSDYIMIPGVITGGTSEVVFLIDSSNGLLGAMTYNDSTNRLDTMPPIDLNRVFANTAIGPPNPPAGGIHQPVNGRTVR